MGDVSVHTASALDAVGDTACAPAGDALRRVRNLVIADFTVGVKLLRSARHEKIVTLVTDLHLNVARVGNTDILVDHLEGSICLLYLE